MAESVPESPLRFRDQKWCLRIVVRVPGVQCCEIVVSPPVRLPEAGDFLGAALHGTLSTLRAF